LRFLGQASLRSADSQARARENGENPRAMARCFVTRQLPGPALDRLRARHEVEVWPERLPPAYEELAARTSKAEGLLALLTDRVDAALIEQCPRLRAIANYAVGYDNIDLEAAAAHGIAVGNTPDVLTEATADLTFALLLAAARRLPEAMAAVPAGDWLTWEPAGYLGQSVQGATLGIVGLGRIGHAVARRAEGFDMTVLYVGGGLAGPGATTAVSFEELLERSDFVSLHCPLTPATHHLIDAAALERMRPSAILINTARGPIVDHDALREALTAGTIAGAALDVTEPEPLPSTDPLLSAPNLIVVPHIGSATRAARERMAALAVDNLLAGLEGQPMPHAVSVAV
jgi:glyoxylate reductase